MKGKGCGVPESAPGVHPGKLPLGALMSLRCHHLLQEFWSPGFGSLRGLSPWDGAFPWAVLSQLIPTQILISSHSLLLILCEVQGGPRAETDRTWLGGHPMSILGSSSSTMAGGISEMFLDPK